MKYCFIFVCQAGELEIKSMLLASSLRCYMQGDYECIAAIPQPASRWGTLSATTLNLMQTLKIRSVPITNRIDDTYPIGNKVSCLSVETSAERIVFLDSDILCLRQFSPEKTFTAPFNAKAADLATFTNEATLWQSIYDLFQLSLPKRRVIASVSGELMLPYFNAGVIAIQNGLDFGSKWEACCRIIDAETSITNKRPWLDQIALPIAIAQSSLTYQCLDECFNYPAHLKPLPDSLPFLCHYHWPAIIRREPRLNQLVAELVATYPLLNKMLLESPAWAQLLKPYHLSASPRRRFLIRPKLKKSPSNNRTEAIITGIPRSGTSYLCRLLHTLPNCVVINEPSQIFSPLANDLLPWQIAILYQTLRRDILDGQPIENKLHNGQVIEDTAIIDTIATYCPSVSRPDFLLVTKNTLAYMARLPQLKQVLPHAPIIACVRHPLDTIASWKTSFPHLKQATVSDFPVGHANDPFLPAWKRQRLMEIATTAEEPLKRALLWRYLAECLLTYEHQIIQIPYEAVVRQPVKVLKNILKQIPNAPTGANMDKIIPSSVRQKREVLDTLDIQAIGDICSRNAFALGYTNLTLNE